MSPSRFAVVFSRFAARQMDEGYFLFYSVAPERDALQVLAFWRARRGSSPAL